MTFFLNIWSNYQENRYLFNKRLNMSYDRYSRFRLDGQIAIVPSVEIPVKSTDYYETYTKGKTRLDLVSFEYYNDPNYDWLIMMANPQYGSMEFSIPQDAILRIPYPLDRTLEQYKSAIDRYDELYGIH